MALQLMFPSHSTNASCVCLETNVQCHKIYARMTSAFYEQLLTTTINLVIFKIIFTAAAFTICSF